MPATTVHAKATAIACLLAFGAWAHAVPEDGAGAAGSIATAVVAPAAARPNTDPVLTLLGERGLLRPLAPTTLVDSMRNSVRDAASDLVMTAMNFLGAPYRLGGDSERTGFDCSGFTRYIFENSIGLALPRRADEQARSAGLLAINRAELRPGDLVFFNTMRRTFSHVGIYVGDDKFIHAPRSGAEVRIEDMRESYWARRFTGARRADLSAALPQQPTIR